MKLTFDEHTRDIVVGALKASGDPDEWQNEMFAQFEKGLTIEVDTEMMGRQLWFTLAVCRDGKSHDDNAEEGTVDWYFGRLSDHAEAARIHNEIGAYKPRFFNPFE